MHGIMIPPTQPPAVRLEETIDMSTTIKFVYVRWNGCNVAFTKRGKYGVVHGSIEKEFTVSVEGSIAFIMFHSVYRVP